jgi:hypothetical protein
LKAGLVIVTAAPLVKAPRVGEFETCGPVRMLETTGLVVV